ncbi:ammonium transporter [bacterium]|nr:ammonium transporter [bacterium]RQV96894.1 MAG: ammonium transporter [bacterium]
MKCLFFLFIFTLIFTMPVMAQDMNIGSVNALDTLWVLIAAFLVFFMQAGFGMVEAGLVRAKNAANILMKNMLDFCIASIGFFIFGYALMFGGNGALLGTYGWFLNGIKGPDGLPLYAFWIFQAAFCGTAATIVAGGMAERMKFTAYLLYSIVISAFIYPIIGHWIWGGGWLSNLNFHDFAGSTVVHVTGGFAALIGTILLKPRIGKFNPDGSPNFIAGHSMPLVALGVFILWLGWFGFNPGSTLGFGDPELVARVTINTNIAAASGAIAGMLLAWGKYGKPDLALTLNGALAGLVAITAPCAIVTPMIAILIGIIAGVLCIFGVRWLDLLKVDDPVGAVAVHGVNGIWGTVAVGLFGQAVLGAPRNGLLFGGGFTQLGIQALGVVSVILFVVGSMWIVFKTIDAMVGLRVSEKEELQGLDIGEHGMESYSGFEIFTTE